MKKIGLSLTKLVALGALVSLCACGSASKVLNPYYETPSDIALQGEANDHALSGNLEKTDTARKALEQMATYQRAHSPQPVNPVIKPAVVRLMWIPDHLNTKGDLVPAHYYYLKVLRDRWAVTDAFELEQQLGSNRGGGNVPFIYGGQISQPQGIR